MQLPIAYALDQKMDANILEHVDLLKAGTLEFREITTDRYPVWEIKQELLADPARGVVINAANEAAIELFIAKKIGFLDISKKIIEAFERFTQLPKNVEDVFALDAEVRAYLRGGV
jgi:1-deoxy-D-xylulose-5-phosphate reductoisomerase